MPLTYTVIHDREVRRVYNGFRGMDRTRPRPDTVAMVWHDGEETFWEIDPACEGVR